MHYPVWYLPQIGGGTLIALIAVFHVFISHFAVGGGLYLVLAERKGLREQSEAILAFTRRHAGFFLLTTMILGSISGVGIWFAISLVNPAATSYLIHNFVFAWAAEWVFFLVEIAAAFVYYYLFGRMEPVTHLKVGYLYFFAAWMSLFLINGIIGVMLTPGSWAESGNFWQGFFNPSFFPSLVFRTCVSVLLAGCYGCLSAAWSREEVVRVEMTRFSGFWSLIAFAGMVPAAFWYLQVLPVEAQQLVLGMSPTAALALRSGLTAVLLLLAITLVAAVARPRFNNRGWAVAAMLCAFVVLGSFEWLREAARRPYVISGVVYSNGIFQQDLPQLREQSFLRSALWVGQQTVTPDNRLAAGRDLFINQCYGCHTLGGVNNDLAALTAKMSYPALVAYIAKMHDLRPFMPPFAGSEEERRALAAYLAEGVHGKEAVDPAAADGPLVAGRSIFEENCAGCHALEDLASALAGQDAAAIGETLLRLDEISEEMQPFAGSGEERVQLAQFLQAPDGDGPPAAADGAAVFERHCGVCHGVEHLAGKTRDWDRQRIYLNLGRLPELATGMPPFAGSDEERQSLASFLDGLKGEM